MPDLVGPSSHRGGDARHKKRSCATSHHVVGSAPWRVRHPSLSLSLSVAPPLPVTAASCVSSGFSSRARPNPKGGVPQRVAPGSAPGVSHEHWCGAPLVEGLVAHCALYKAVGVHPCDMVGVAAVSPRLQPAPQCVAQALANGPGPAPRSLKPFEIAKPARCRHQPPRHVEAHDVEQPRV